MRITIFVLHKTAEVYQKFSDTEAAIRWLSRTGYLNQRTVIVSKGENAKVFEKVEDLRALQKGMNDFLFPHP